MWFTGSFFVLYEDHRLGVIGMSVFITESDHRSHVVDTTEVLLATTSESPEIPFHGS